jgi:hypothetical protein
LSQGNYRVRKEFIGNPNKVMAIIVIGDIIYSKKPKGGVDMSCKPKGRKCASKKTKKTAKKTAKKSTKKK